jgi:hypothetical protein
MSQVIPLYLPTYISSIDYQPARVLPRLLFYNGQVDCQSWYVEGFLNSTTSSVYGYEQNTFPYFDNYNVVSGSFPTTDSLSLLFNNESSPYGAIPTANLYTDYWETYIQLLYNPYTRLLNCSAIIPLADYFQMNLNDVVEFRGNYYHLRAINDYNLQNGECSLQLLGPIIPDSITGILFPCTFDFNVSISTTTTTTTAAPTTTTTAGPTTTTTTAAPTTTTTAGPTTTTTTTTSGPTTTTTIGPIGGYNYYAVSDNCCGDESGTTIAGVVAITSSIAMTIGQTVGSNTWTSSTGRHCATVEYLTSSTTPLLFTIEQSQIYTNTYGIGQCQSCNRDFIPTIVGNNCDYFILTNYFGGTTTGSWNDCTTGNAVTQSSAGGTITMCTRTSPIFSWPTQGDRVGARLSVSCSYCGTF